MALRATAAALWIGRYKVRQAALIIIASRDNCGCGHANSHNDHTPLDL